MIAMLKPTDRKQMEAVMMNKEDKETGIEYFPGVDLTHLNFHVSLSPI